LTTSDVTADTVYNTETDQEHTDAYTETDSETYIRTDDEEAGGTDWEETRRRWINR